MRFEPDSWKREVPQTDYRGARTGSTRIYSSDPTRESAYSQKITNVPLGSNVLTHPAQRSTSGLDILELFASEPAGLTKSYFRNAQILSRLGRIQMFTFIH